MDDVERVARALCVEAGDDPDQKTCAYEQKCAGRELVQEKFPSVRQQGSIDGIITGIRVRDATAHVTLQSEGQQISGCEIRDRALAKQLAAKYLEPVRLFGRGKWTRDADGVWQLADFRVESFQALDDAPLGRALEELRAIPMEWGDDEYSLLTNERQGPPWALAVGDTIYERFR